MLVAQLEDIADRKRNLIREREGILSRQKAWAQAESQLGSVTLWCRTIATRLGQLTYQEKRLALDALGVQVTLYHTDHEPRYVITASIPLDSEIVSISS